MTLDSLQEMVDLALTRGASYAEIRYQKDVYESNLLKNGVPEVSSFDTDRGVSMRVIHSGGLGFGATDQTGKRDLRAMVDRTVRAAKAASGQRKEPITLGEAEMATGSTMVKPRVSSDAVSLDSRIALLKETDDAALDEAKRLGVHLPGRYLSLNTFVTEKHIVNSDGADVRSVVPRAETHLTLTAAEASKGSVQRSVSLGESSGWEAVERWDLPRRTREEVFSLAHILKDAREFRADVLDVVLGPEVTGIVAHESGGHPGEADRLLGREAAQAGETYLGLGDRGRQIGSPVVNVVDDPTLPRSFGFYLSDDEGVKARRRYLMKEGRIEEFLQNRETSAVTGIPSNGSSRAVSYDREPIVRMANTFVEPGDMSFDEMVEGIVNGVYVRNFMEWNIDDRRYNQRYVGLEAYRIVDGELGDRVRNPVIEMTTPALWSAVDAVGKDVEFASAHCGKGDPMQAIPVWTGGPHLRLRSVRLGGAR
jgi:TldD protein